jgi:hypothetical protein
MKTPKGGWKDPVGPTNNLVGPEPKLTPEIQKIIVDALSVGCYLNESLMLASIDTRTFRRWMARGAAEVARREKAERDTVFDSKNSTPRKKITPQLKKKMEASAKMAAREAMFVEFRRAVEQAIARAESSMLGIITRAAAGGAVIETTTMTRTKDDGTTETQVIEKRARPEWTAAAWRLERRHPARWGRRLELIAPPELPVEGDEADRRAPIDTLRQRIEQLHSDDLEPDDDDE